MKKRKIISLSISLFLFAIGIIAIIQLYPYMNLRNCNIKTSMSLNGTQVIIKNNGNSIAKFPETKFSIYRNKMYIGDAHIPEIEIKPHQLINKSVNITLHLSLNNTLKVIGTNETIMNGTIKIPFLLWKITVPFKIEKPDSGKPIVFVWGRKIER